jgi:hypothetical protein
MNNIKIIEKLAKEYACINSSPLLFSTIRNENA